MGAQLSSAALFNEMTHTLQGLSKIVIYCDDLFVHTKDRVGHMQKIRSMLARLKQHGLNIAPKK